MGSNKRDGSSSSSSSDSDSSKEHSKIKKKSQKTRKRSSSWSEEDTKKHKSKRQEDSSPEARRRPKHQDDSDNEERSRKRRRSSSEEHKGRSSNQRGRHDHRSDDRDRKSHDHRQDDRDRKQDDRDHRSGDRHRAAPRHDERDRDRRGDRRDDRDRRDDGGRNYRDRNNRGVGGGGGGGGGGFRRGNRDRDDNFDHASAKWGKDVENKGGGKKAPGEKQKPNFGLSGKLTEETNTFKGVVIKYSEPPEARKPKRRWRLYPFKGEKALQTLYIHRESAYLIGRDRKVVDLPVDHPSCSKQHAALQYRLVPFTRDDGSAGKRVRPYLIDLESSNGTFINNKQIEAKKYVELLERDVIKFGFSSREYVLLHENSKDEAQDDDVKNEEELLPIKKEEPTE